MASGRHEACSNAKWVADPPVQRLPHMAALGIAPWACLASLTRMATRRPRSSSHCFQYQIQTSWASTGVLRATVLEIEEEVGGQDAVE